MNPDWRFWQRRETLPWRRAPSPAPRGDRHVVYAHGAFRYSSTSCRQRGISPATVLRKRANCESQQRRPPGHGRAQVFSAAAYSPDAQAVSGLQAVTAEPRAARPFTAVAPVILSGLAQSLQQTDLAFFLGRAGLQCRLKMLTRVRVVSGPQGLHASRLTLGGTRLAGPETRDEQSQNHHDTETPEPVTLESSGLCDLAFTCSSAVSH